MYTLVLLLCTKSPFRVFQVKDALKYMAVFGAESFLRERCTCDGFAMIARTEKRSNSIRINRFPFRMGSPRPQLLPSYPNLITRGHWVDRLTESV